jgi:hypothetical protein
MSMLMTGNYQAAWTFSAPPPISPERATAVGARSLAPAALWAEMLTTIPIMGLPYSRK